MLEIYVLIWRRLLTCKPLYFVSKMEYYGIKGVISILIKSYIQKGRQILKLNLKISKWDNFNIGVP